MFSVLSAGCLLLLQRLQPVFFVSSVGLLAYQGWLLAHRPAGSRTWSVKAIFAVSVILNAVIIAGWIVISVRYR